MTEIARWKWHELLITRHVLVAFAKETVESIASFGDGLDLTTCRAFAVLRLPEIGFMGVYVATGYIQGEKMF